MGSVPAEDYGAVAGVEAALPERAEVDANNPPWNIATAFLSWLGSVFILLGVSIAAGVVVLIYASRKYGITSGEQLKEIFLKDKVAVLIQVIAVIPAHLLTIVLAWAVVTNLGRRPFWRTLGWRWNSTLEIIASICLAMVLLVVGGLITYFYGGEPTDIDQIINSSTAARFVLAFLATATAPFVEEVIYRGILYPALQRAIGIAWAIVGVTLLFTLVHYWQYQNNISVLAAIGFLSLALTLVRAYTGRLLPCFVIHLVFNGLQSLYIIVQPYLTKPETVPIPKPGVVISTLARLIGA
ncbi:MAG: CPBP family intramembrane metalloprotease [Pyrinomonadaceae bacterium]|nr:CPBP family intramembrane metalloprotease [Pyrinomonadaceae bacterium]